MSEIKVNSIKGTGASSAAITIHASDGTCTVPSIPAGRNVLYNGAMQVYQRGSSTGVGASNGTVFATDRWGIFTQNTGSRYTISQDSESPDGFAHSLKIDCTTADTSLASNEEVTLQTKIEGFDVQRFQKGTSGAKAYTLSFWAKSSKTGTYICRLLGRDNTTSHVAKAYTVANTNWNKYTINFPADTDSSRKDDSDNGEALRVVFWLVAGSGTNTGTLQETWANSSDSGAATGQVNFADSTSNILYITGIQLETGSTATDFEYKPYGDELSRCQRYYYRHVDDTNDAIGAGGWYTASLFTTYVGFPTTMRAAPTLEKTTGSDYYRVWSGGTNQDGDDLAMERNSNTGCVLDFGTNLSGTAGNPGNVNTNNAAAKISFSAEL